MNFAIESDIQNNKKGKPGLNKLKVLEKVCSKLKNYGFCELFLDADGLNIISRFISKLPDGSWPLSHVRSKILKLIYDLPTQVDHLRGTELGKTLALLQNSPKELAENKKLIQTIKDKWSRIICNINVEYATLEQCERAFHTVPLTLKPQEEDELLTKRPHPTEDEMNEGLSYALIRSKGSGYNFSVRPGNNYNAQRIHQPTEDQQNLDKALMRMRRGHKRL